MPSGWPINHAFAHGVPLITRPSALHGPEIEYLEDGVNGRLVDGDLDAFARGIAEVVGSPGRRAQLASGALRSGSALGLDAMVDAFDQAVAAVTSGEPRGRRTATPRPFLFGDLRAACRTTGRERTRRAPPFAPQPRVDLVAAVRRHPIVAAFPVVLLVVLAAIAAYNRPAVFTAETRLAVGRVDPSVPGGLVGFTDATRALAERYSRSVRSEAVLQPVSGPGVAAIDELRSEGQRGSDPGVAGLPHHRKGGDCCGGRAAVQSGE